MRQARSTSVVLSDDGNTFIGFHLEADHVAEHEWGIRSLLEAFGAPWRELRGTYGLRRRQISRQGRLYWHTGDRLYLPQGKKRRRRQKTFGLTTSFDSEPFRNVLIPGRVEDAVAGAWDAGDFGILVAEPLEARLRELGEAFGRLDVAIFLAGHTNPFQGPGLSIMLASRLPAGVTEEWERVDRDAERLQDAAEATGIEGELAAAGCLVRGRIRPRWADEPGGEIEFWVVPKDESRFTYGWYSLGDLRAWTKGEGPVVKSPEEIEDYRAERERRAGQHAVQEKG